LICAVLTFASVQPINNFTSDILKTKFGLSSPEAGRLYGYVYMIAGIILIPVGYFNDYYGHIALTQIAAALLCCIGTMWWAFFPATNTDLLIVPIVLMGLATGFIGGTF
jgi:nitrate/nitrite transporter NarK